MLVLDAKRKKVAVITGGTSGIGLATAELFLAEGYCVVLIGRSNDKGRKALAKLKSTEQRCVFISGNVAKASECERVLIEAVKAFGQLDVLVNSAGLYLECAIEQMSEADYDEIMAINCKGTYFMCKYAVEYLRKSNAGAIVNVSSDAGINGNFLCSAYCASKGAVTVFTKALALELAPYNIRVNCVCPGDIDTPMTRAQFGSQADVEAELRQLSNIYPLGRIGKDQEAAAVICFLASSKASFVVGAAWSVDGGVTAY